MTLRTYFCYSHNEDSLRVREVYECWLHSCPDHEVAGVWDQEACAMAEEGKDDLVETWMERQLDGTRVTVVLIGSHSVSCPWVVKGIQKSIERGNTVIGVAINAIPDSDGDVSLPGENPLTRLCFADSGVCVASRYPCYQWICDGGQHNLCKWIEGALDPEFSTVA